MISDILLSTRLSLLLRWLQLQLQFDQQLVRMSPRLASLGNSKGELPYGKLGPS
jgi:hypothetical protein